MNLATLIFEPLVSPTVWLAMVGVSAAALVVYAWRRPPVASRLRWAVIIALMALSMAVVLLLLLNPQSVTPIPAPEGKPALTVVLDTSASMATEDGPERQSRLAAAVRQAEAAAAQLRDEFDLRYYTFADNARPAADLAMLHAEGRSTNLAAALHEGARQKAARGQAIWLLSDGIPTVPNAMSELDEAIRTARTLDVPVYTTAIGTDRVAADLVTELRYAQDMAFIGQEATITAQLRHTGLSGRNVNVSLASGGKELVRQTVTLPPQGLATVRFPTMQKAVGVYTYEVRAEPVPGEIVLSNNSALYVLKVVDKPVRLLVLEGKPYWDSKFFVQTLARVPAVQVDSIVRLRDDRFVLQTRSAAAIPGAKARPGDSAAGWRVINSPIADLADAAKLSQYQIVVLGRDAEPFLTPATVANLQQWVAREGGCVLCYRGAPASVIDERLGKLLPVTWSSAAETHFRLRVTDTGRQQMQWLAGEGGEGDDTPAELPLLAMRTRHESSKPLAVVVASAGSADETTPAFVYQPYGAGRVVVIEGSGMWRWGFMPPERRAVGAFYESLWQGTIRWLVSGGGLQPGQQRLLRADATTFRPDEHASATLLVRRDLASTQSQVELQSAEGQSLGQFAAAALGDEPGVYRVDFGKLPEGGYRALITGATGGDPATQTAFEVRDPGEERLNLKARPDLMARIARDTGGRALEDGTAEELRRKFQEHDAQSRPTLVERVSLWDRWWVMAGALALWALCWGVRRHSGLV